MMPDLNLNNSSDLKVKDIIENLMILGRFTTCKNQRVRESSNSILHRFEYNRRNLTWWGVRGLTKNQTYGLVIY